jgi:hypothetical protein
VGSLKSLFGKLSRSAEEIRSEHIRDWSSSIADVTPIAEIEPRRRHQAAGVIHRIRIDPREGRGSVEATINDGTGRLSARWLGRRSLSGITLGKGVVITGTVGLEKDGLPLVLNPEYELVDGPEHR